MLYGGSYTLLVYNMQLTNIGKVKCMVCPANPTVGRATTVTAYYVPGF